MTVYDIKRLALILAIQAEIEAMKIFNTQRAFDGWPPGYPESEFQAKADELRELASKHDDQL